MLFEKVSKILDLIMAPSKFHLTGFIKIKNDDAEVTMNISDRKMSQYERIGGSFLLRQHTTVMESNLGDFFHLQLV